MSDLGRCTQCIFTVVKSHPEPQEIMSKNKKSTLQQETEYVAFLKKKLESKNYKANVPREEYNKS